MSDIRSPQSATAPFTASSAWAASGISAERETLEKPTPLMATLQRFSHMALPLFVKHDLFRKPVSTFRDHALFGRRRARQTKLWQRDVVVERLEHDLHPPPDLRLRVGRSAKVTGEQRAGRLVKLHDDAGVGDGGRKALVAAVVHDGIGVDRTGATHGFELQIYSHAFDAGRIWRMLEMSATLTALQLQNTPLGRIPEWLRPLVWNGDRPGHLAPVAHSILLFALCLQLGLTPRSTRASRRSPLSPSDRRAVRCR